MSIVEITENELKEYPVIRYGTPAGFYVDIMDRIGEVFTYDSLEFEIKEYKGIKVRVATPEVLFEMKKDTVRFQDKADAIYLKDLIKKRKEK